MKNLFQAGIADDLKARVAQLHPDSERVWGSMTPAQAMAHCSASLEWALGERIPPRAGLMVRIMGRLIKPMVFKDDKPFRRNSPTAPDLIVHNEPNLQAGAVPPMHHDRQVRDGGSRWLYNSRPQFLRPAETR